MIDNKRGGNGSVHTDRLSKCLSTIPDESNTLTYKSTSKNDSTRDPLHSPITNIIILAMVRSGILDIKQHKNKWYFEAETLAQVYI